MSGDSQAFSLASQNGIDSADAQGNTALIAAAFAGNDALALQLIGAKADISKQNDTGCDATWVAAAYGKADVLKTLLAAGGSALTCNKQVLFFWPSRFSLPPCFAFAPFHSHSALQADSALMAAVMKGHEGTVQLLLQAGAAVAHKNKNGDSAIRSLPQASLHACVPHPVCFEPVAKCSLAFQRRRVIRVLCSTSAVGCHRRLRHRAAAAAKRQERQPTACSVLPLLPSISRGRPAGIL